MSIPRLRRKIWKMTRLVQLLGIFEITTGSQQLCALVSPLCTGDAFFPVVIGTVFVAHELRTLLQWIVAARADLVINS
jgi:hypothetical protein